MSAAKIDSGVTGTTDQLTVDPTSNAARVTLYDAAGREVIKKPTTNGFLAHILIRQSTGTTQPKLIWSLFNPTPGSIFRVRRIVYNFHFDGTATASGANYNWFRTAFGAPTGGTTITPTQKKTGSASTADVRFLDTGLTQTVNASVGDAFIKLNWSENTTAQMYPFSWPLEYQMKRLNSAIELQFNEGIGLFLVVNNAIAGAGFSGFVEWDETTS